MARKELIDLNAVMDNIPTIMGLDLKRTRNGWQGGYYLNRDKHPYRRDKLKIWIWEYNIWLKEEGGNAMSLQTWLCTYGGAADYKEAYRIMRGNAIPLPYVASERGGTEGIYVPEEEFAEYCKYDLGRCNLYTWMCRIFGQQRTMEAWSKYDVTSNENGDTVFFYRDMDGRICHDKIMRYRFDGHRDKAYISRKYKTSLGYTNRCLYGSHLIKEGEPIHCVESEKSCLIMSIVEPQKTWVACGGISQIRDVDSQMWLYPDVDGIEKWGAIAGAQIVEWWENELVGEHDDIADLVLRKIRNGSLKI